MGGALFGRMFAAGNESCTAAGIGTVDELRGSLPAHRARPDHLGARREVHGLAPVEYREGSVPEAIVAVGLPVLHDPAINLIHV